LEESSGRISETWHVIHSDDDSRFTVRHNRSGAWDCGRDNRHTGQPSLNEDTGHTLAGREAWKDQEVGLTQ
jgi:hypothetical protein